MYNLYAPLKSNLPLGKILWLMNNKLLSIYYGLILTMKLLP